MSEQTVTVNSRKYDGSIRRSWRGKLVERKDPLIELVGEFDVDVAHPDLGLIKRGTISHEYFWLDRWYNVFRFHEPGGELRNFYCNVSMPPTFEDGVLDYVDLDIDVVVWKDLSYMLLDREEFEINAALFSYPERVLSGATSTLGKLITMIETREFPFESLSED